MIKEKDICPTCAVGTIKLVFGDYPYNIDHLKCDYCDSTYTLKYDILYQEDVNTIASETCDFIQEKLRKYMVELQSKDENLIFDFILNLIDKHSSGYKHHH